MTIQFGDADLIERRRKEEARIEFEDEMYGLFMSARIPWAAVGYLVASMADVATSEYEDTQAWLDFQAGFEHYLKEQRPFVEIEEEG